MVKPPLPPDEAARLAVIARHGLTDPGREHIYDRVAELAADLFNVSIALVSIVGRDFQCFRGARGLDVPGTPRDIAFCAFAVLADDVMIVPDARHDPRFREHPLVTGAPYIRFYAGAPLMLDGHAVGTLCVIDGQVREFSADDARRLQALAGLVVDMLRTRLDRLAAESADERLRQIIDAMPTGLLVYDRQDRLVSFNAAFREMFFGDRQPGPEPGLTRQELLERFEKTGRTIVLSGSDTSFRQHIGKGERTEPYEIRTSDGQWVSVREVRTPDGHLITASSDITELKRREQELDTQSQLLRATLDSVDQGIALFDAGRRLVVGNDKLPALLRLPQAQVATGTALGALVNAVARKCRATDGEAGFFSATSPDLRAEGESREATFEMPCGRFLHLKAAARAGDMIILTCSDISEQKQVERLKAEFVSTVSHELRTPLTSISGALRILGSGLVGEMSAKAREFVGLARKNSDRLSRLVNDLLEADRIESGQIRLERKPVDLRALLRKAIDHNLAYAAEFDVRLELEEGKETGAAVVLADEARLLQVADNLLSNAIKYSPAGEAVTVAVAASGDLARFTVSDLGSGVPEAFRSKIFQRFTRADSTDHRATQGSGLGLSIARGIVEQHGGRIGFDSQIGRGTSFWVELPIHASATAIRETPERPTILMCVKDAEAARALTATLEGAGVAVELAGDTARERLASGGDYAGILLEVSGDGDAADLVRSLRREGSAPPPPAVLLSTKLTGAEVGATRKSVVSNDRSERGVQTPSGRAGQPRILHVEDDADLLYLVAESFSGLAEIDAAQDIASAQQMLQSCNYDLVILDLLLPDGNGSELLPEIMARSGATPVIVFSALEPDDGLVESVHAALTKSQNSITDLVEMSRQLTGLAGGNGTGGAA